jgi:hypothetical protein
MTAQSTIVAAEPQLPGAGFRYPTPKKVATRVAQSGARGRTGVEASDRAVAIIRMYCQAKAGVAEKFLVLVRIGQVFVDGIAGVGNGRGNDVGSAGPFPQIDSATAFAAEGEFGIGTLHRILADRATKLK